jgi:hypothetical protein
LPFGLLLIALAAIWEPQHCWHDEVVLLPPALFWQQLLVTLCCSSAALTADPSTGLTLTCPVPNSGNFSAGFNVSVGTAACAATTTQALNISVAQSPVTMLTVPTTLDGCGDVSSFTIP